MVTTWDWSDQQHYLHDLAASDKRNPTANANGPLFGQPEYSMDAFPMVDPKTNTATLMNATRRDADMRKLWTSSGGGVVGWVDTKVWDQTHDAAKAQGWTALVSSGDRAPWQTEGGKGNTPMAVHIQVRPDPLAD